MTADEARVRVGEIRRSLDRAMRALSVPGPDGDAAVRSLRAAADACDRLIVTIVNDRLGGRSWK